MRTTVEQTETEEKIETEYVCMYVNMYVQVTYVHI